MFDWVQNNKRVIQIILGLIILPFAFFGIDSYFRGGEFGAEVARVGDYKITQQEFQQALRERQDNLRRMFNNSPVDPAMLDSPEIRFAALEQIVRDRLILAHAVRTGLVVTDEQIRDVIMTHDSFRDSGKFSHELYESFLRSQNLNSVGFEARLRRELLQQPIMDVFGEAGFVSNTVADRMVRLSEQTREISIATISPIVFASQVNIDETAVKGYYDSHSREFEVPEQVRLEYVVLSLDNLAQQVDVSSNEVRQTYEQNSTRFSSPEEREASHILIRAAENSGAEGKAAAKSKIEEILKQVLEKPDRFADLAREHSQDPGSAQNGGDLGFLVRGAANKQFDDALFAMKAGDIVGPIETDFGFHAIRLKSIRGGAAKPFEEVRAMIESELKRAGASKRYAELAEQLNNLAYEQSDSLKPAAEALKVPVQQSPWVTRRPVQGSPLGGEKFLKAAFSEDVLRNKRNSEVVEVAPGTLIAARLLEHKPAQNRPLDEVGAEIRKRLMEDETRKRAYADGKERLSKLRKGEDAGVTWSRAIGISRAKADGVSETVLREIFRVDTAKLPAFAGVEDGANGYQLVRIERVSEPGDVAAQARKTAGEQLRRLIGQELLADYVSAMKQRVEVKIKPEVIEKK